MDRIIQHKPHHLAHYEEDLVFFIKEVALDRDCVMASVTEDRVLPSDSYGSNGFFLADEGLGRAYIRVFYYRPTGAYYTTMTYSPWPAFSTDPIREEKEWGSLREALSAEHRIYRYYRHESRCPMPFLDNYVKYRLTAEAVTRVEEEVATQIRG